MEGLNKVLLEQSLKFEFRTSNNQAKYEVLIFGLKFSLELGVQKLHIKGDSQLLVNQIKGVYTR